MGRPVSPVFVGRDAELSRLMTAVEAAAAGRPSIVLVGGEAGVGKTRLMHEFATVLDDAATVLYGRCVPVADGELPFAPFVEAFRRLPRETTAAHEALSTVFGDREDRQASGPTGGPPMTGWTVQSRLFELVLEHVGRLASDRPLVIVLEDLHWADRSSRELLLFLARNLGSERVLLIATYRSDELHRRHPLLAALSELGRLPAVERLEVGRLGPADAAELVRALVTPEPTAAAVEQIVARSEGIPFHAEELIAAASGDRSSSLTPSLAETLTVRLAALPPDSIRLVRIAAVIGRQADHQLLARVAGLDEPGFIEAVRPAIDHHILDAVDGPIGTRTGYEFRHALLTEAAYAELLPAERAAIHREVAAVLEASPLDAAATEAVRRAEVAYHWDRAHDPERGLASAVAAGLAADRARAPAEALHQYTRALEHWRSAAGATELAGMDEAELLGRAAWAAQASGELSAAVRLAASALERLPAPAPVERAVALFELLHTCLWDVGDVTGSLAALERGLALTPAANQPRLRARLLALLAWRTASRDRFDEARVLSEEAVALARGTGEAGAEHLARFSLGSVLLMTGEVARGEELLRQAADDGGDVSEFAVLMGRVRLLELLIEAGRPMESASALRALREETRERGLRGPSETRLSTMIGDALLAAGDLAGAELVLKGALAADDSRVQVWPHMYLGWLHVCQGNLGGAAQSLAAAERFLSPAHNEQAGIRFVRAVVARAEGRLDDGRRAVTEILDLNPDLRYDTIPLAMVVGIQLEADRAAVAATRRRPEMLAEARAIGATYADLMGRAVDAAGERGRMPKLTALAAHVAAERTRLDGAPDPAAFDAAARAYDRAGRPYDAAECRFRAGEAMLRSGRPRAEAREPLRAAWRTASSIGAAGLARDVVALAHRSRIDLGDEAEPPAEASRTPVPADPYGLTPREQEVLSLLAGGHSNRRIAERLFITESTAGVHVSNVIGKLGVSGRAGAAAIGVRLGLVPDAPHEAGADSEPRRTEP